MTAEDKIFDNICALSDEAEAAGLTDVALVLEFALDVFLKETNGRAQTPSNAVEIDTDKAENPSTLLVLEQSARRIEVQTLQTPHLVPSLGWSMSAFPLARVPQPKRDNAERARKLVERDAS